MDLPRHLLAAAWSERHVQAALGKQRAALFVELRAHTGFSFGDGTASPERLVERAIALGFTALGITDTADLGGIPRFVNAANLSGTLRPIVGAELRVDGRPAAFIVRTPEGYRNLA